MSIDVEKEVSGIGYFIENEDLGVQIMDINKNKSLESEHLEEENEEDKLLAGNNMKNGNIIQDSTNSDNMTEDEIEDSASEDIGSINDDKQNYGKVEERVEVEQNHAPENFSYNLRPIQDRGGHAYKLDHQMETLSTTWHIICTAQ